MSKVLTIAGVSILALGLVLGLALPALAAPPAWARPGADDSQIVVVKGKVSAVDEANQKFVIQSGEQELIISVDDDTKYFKLCVPGRIISLARHRMELVQQNQLPPLEDVDMPKLQRAKLKRLRPFGEGAEFSDIAVGDRVAVWLAPQENGNLAERVLIIKPTTYARVSGTISVPLAGETITITPDGGVAVTLDYNEGTVFILNGFITVEEGQYAHAIYDSDNMVTKRVVVYQEVP